MSLKLRSQCLKVGTALLFYFCCFPSFGQDATLLDNNKKVITKYFEVVINDHNLNRKGEFFQADYILHTMDGKEVHSTQDSLHNSMLRWLFAAIPDVYYNIDNIVTGGDMIGITTTATGTARSEMFGLAVGQKKVSYKQMFFYLLKDGKIAEQWEVVDPDGLKAQLEKK